MSDFAEMKEIKIYENTLGYSLGRDANNKSYIIIEACLDNNTDFVSIPEYISNLPVTHIAPCAFKDFKNIKNVSFPKTLKKIGRQAFYGCNIEILSLPQNLEYIDEEAFAQNQNLFTISFNEGIKVIHDLAFEGCTSLPYVIISKGTDCIYTSIFNNCASLSTISFEGDVGRLQSTDAGFASGCPSLNLIDTNPENKRTKSINGILYDVVDNCLIRVPPAHDIKNIEIPSQISRIETNAFEGVRRIDRIKITNDIDGIEKSKILECCIDNVCCVPNSNTERIFLEHRFKTYPATSQIDVFLKSM